MTLRRLRVASMTLLALGLVACGDEEAETATAAAAPPTEPGGNRAPLISGEPTRSILTGEQYEFQPLATDPDGDAVLFGGDGLPAWLSLSPTTGRLTGRPQAVDVGMHRGIVIWVTDGQAETLLPTFDVEVLPASAPANRPPQIAGSPASAVTVGSAYDFVPSASDPDGNNLSFQIVNRPAWANFNPIIGRLSGTPNSGAVGVYPDILIRVSDGIASAAIGPFTIVVNPPPSQNRAPLISGVPDREVVLGASWSFQPQAADPDGDTLTFQVFNAPPWTSFDTATGRLSGTPGPQHVGRHSGIQIVVRDGQASATLSSFAVTVIDPNVTPVISGTPAATATVGTAYSFVPTASDANGDSLSFSIVNRPAWLSFNPSTGALSGTPGAGQVGNFTGIAITVSDGTASATLGPFSIAVAAANRAPVLSGSPLGSIAVGQAYSFVPSASDPDGDSLSFSIVNRPSWASFNSSSGRLSGTPGPGNVGSTSGIVIRVSDGSATTSLPAFAINVFVPNQAPVIGGTPAVSALVGSPYSFQPTASDPEGDSLGFSVSNLPLWATFNSSNGRISGTPGAGHVGSYAGIAITVSDGASSATLGPFAIQVQPVANGSATLSWTAPSENTDGSPLNDLAGFKVYWGTASGNYGNSVTLANPSLSTYIVENLLPGTTYYFATKAYNSQGLESSFSNEASKAIP